jgi:arylsulfatase A-like enzyme
MRAIVLAPGGLHVGYLGCYGNEWIQTPAFDRLAADGVVFDQHYADDPTPSGAWRAWRTGRHALPTAGTSAAATEAAPDLFALLRSHGIRTELITDRAELPASAASSWDAVQTVPAGASPEHAERWAKTVRKRLRDLASADGWLLWADVHLLEPPWSAPAEFLERYQEDEPSPEELADEGSPDEAAPELLADWQFRQRQNAYAAAVSYLDHLLGPIVEQSERMPAESLFLAVTSDQGQAIDELSESAEAPEPLHEERTHVPLLLGLPGRAEAGRRVAALTQSVDLAPTLFDLFGAACPVVHGRSLLPSARGQTTAVRPYACAGLRQATGVELALRTPEWAFLLSLGLSPDGRPGRARLYRKPEDRWEVNDLRQHHLEFTERLETTLRGFIEACYQPGELRPPELPTAVPEPGPNEGGNVP